MQSQCAICRNSLNEPSIEYQANPSPTNDNGLSIAFGNCGHGTFLFFFLPFRFQATSRTIMFPSSPDALPPDAALPTSPDAVPPNFARRRIAVLPMLRSSGNVAGRRPAGGESRRCRRWCLLTSTHTLSLEPLPPNHSFPLGLHPALVEDPVCLSPVQQGVGLRSV